MTKMRLCTFLGLASCLAALAAQCWPISAYGAECKRKTAGFYLEDTNAGAPHILSRSLENLPGSLTGVLGDAEHGRDVLISRQRGDCLSCHKLSTFFPAVAQGSIGPALDGVGSKYNDGQLRQVLLQPKSYFPETIMPSYYRAGAGEASVLTAAEIEDLVAYLGTLK